jgi:hypothetical protein
MDRPIKAESSKEPDKQNKREGRERPGKLKDQRRNLATDGHGRTRTIFFWHGLRSGCSPA